MYLLFSIRYLFFLALSLVVFGYVLYINIQRDNTYKYIASVENSLKIDVINDSEDIKYMDDINQELDTLLN